MKHDSPVTPRLLVIFFASSMLFGCGGGSSGGGDEGGSAPPPSTFTVTANATGAGTGNISPTSLSVSQGSSTTFNVAPSNTSVVSSVSGCNGSFAGSIYTTGPITANCAVTANFALRQYTVTATGEDGGSISPPTATVDHGQVSNFTVSPDTGFGISAVTGCNGSLSGTIYTTGAITEACTISASFAANRYTVSATAGNGGTITPNTTTVDEGQTTILITTPESGFLIDAVTGCGGSLDGTTYTTGPITSDCQVTASFLAVPANFLEQLGGIYTGQMRSPKNIFFLDSTTLTVEVDGSTADITKEAFFGRTCMFDGALVGESYPVTGDGAFQCSDFSQGSWTAPKIAKIDATTLLATFALNDGVDPYEIQFGGFGGTAPDSYNPDDDYWLRDALVDTFSGSYDGQMKSTDSCAGFSFTSTSAEIDIQVDGDTVDIVRDSFFDGICEFSGTRDSFEDGVLQASGTFRCSNFDEGTWSSEHIVMADSNVLFANLRVSVPARACSYTVRHIVFKVR